MAALHADRGTLRGIHVLLGVLAFFGVIFAVNGVFLYAALSTHTGIVSKQPYRKGLDYNKRIAAGERQKALGWREEVELDQKAETVRLALTDKTGWPVTGLEIDGFIGRPSTEQQDIALTLIETSKPGTYSAVVNGLLPGKWLLKLNAKQVHPDGPEVVYRVRKRLWLKP